MAPMFPGCLPTICKVALFGNLDFQCGGCSLSANNKHLSHEILCPQSFVYNGRKVHFIPRWDSQGIVAHQEVFIVGRYYEGREEVMMVIIMKKTNCLILREHY
jgi:hypothetical protein